MERKGADLSLAKLPIGSLSPYSWWHQVMWQTSKDSNHWDWREFTSFAVVKQLQTGLWLPAYLGLWHLWAICKASALMGNCWLLSFMASMTQGPIILIFAQLWPKDLWAWSPTMTHLQTANFLTAQGETRVCIRGLHHAIIHDLGLLSAVIYVQPVVVYIAFTFGMTLLAHIMVLRQFQSYPLIVKWNVIRNQEHIISNHTLYKSLGSTSDTFDASE